MDFVSVYVTSAGPDEAKRIAVEIVGERLAACANILPNMESVYWWDGKLQNDSETVLLLKTRKELADAVIRRVKELHSYSVPCAVALPIVEGNPDYLDWIKEETKVAKNNM